jgi:hypothetical protein
MGRAGSGVAMRPLPRAAIARVAAMKNGALHRAAPRFVFRVAGQHRIARRRALRHMFG